VSASVGVTTLALAGYASWGDYGAIWATWWLGDAAGALIFAPPLLLWSAGFPLRGTRARWVEALILVLVTVGVAATVFSGWVPAPLRRLEFLVIPPIVWIAFRFGPREAATATLAMSTIALWATVRGGVRSRPRRRGWCSCPCRPT
jgi:integral membrane sensor domain MASE1